MPYDTKQLEDLGGYKPNNSPNEPIVLVSELEGLAEQMSGKVQVLSQIKDLPIEKAVAIANTWSRLDGLRTKEIHTLRQLFE